MTPVMEYSYYSWQVYPSGDVYHSGDGSVFTSYGRTIAVHRRLQLRVCSLPVWSRRRRRRRRRLPLRQFLRAQRSPNADYDYVAWFVTSSGFVDSNYVSDVTRSYGERSPNTIYGHAWQVDPSGVVVSGGVMASYGIWCD